MAKGLPQIKMKQFGGDYTEWTNFWANFKMLVDKNTAVRSYTKQQLLLQNLTGISEGHLKGLPQTGEAYETAKELLEDHYGNPRNIMSHHMRKLLSLKTPPIQASTVEHRVHYDTMHQHVTCLLQQDLDIRTFTTLLLPVIEGKVPYAV